MLLYQSDQNICFTYMFKFTTLFCISNIHFFNFSFPDLYFTRVDENKFLVTGYTVKSCFLKKYG